MARRKRWGGYSVPTGSSHSNEYFGMHRPTGAVTECDYEKYRFVSYFAPLYETKNTGGQIETRANKLEFHEDTKFAVESDVAGSILAVPDRNYLSEGKHLSFCAPKPTIELPVAPIEPQTNYLVPPPEPAFTLNPVGLTTLARIISPLGKIQSRNIHRDELDAWRARCAQVEATNRTTLENFRAGEKYQSYLDMQEEFQNRCAKLEDDYLRAQQNWIREKRDFENQRDTETQRLKEMIAGIREGDEKAFASYFAVAVNALPYPIEIPREAEITCSLDSSLIYVELNFPHAKNIRFYKWHNFNLKDVPDKERSSSYDLLFYSVIVRTMFDIAKHSGDAFRAIALNAFTKFKDPATGKNRKELVASVSSDVESVRELQLVHLDPKAAFFAWKGISARSLVETVPVKPIIVLNKKDARFVAGRDVLEESSASNLAEMDWEDFEHLIRQLFEQKFKERGAEVFVTQSSRDRGVDAVIFDPDPLTGGRIVIQAKRYTATVGAAAVRELYGTMIAESATRGILVTTSNFGSDSVQFAKDKNIVLINGQNLLSLLEDVGRKYKIDLRAARENRREKDRD